MALTTVKSDQIQTSVALAGSPTTTTQSASDNSTKVATTAYVETAVANLVASAPAALNTLDELAAALNDDASFSTTITNSIATKLPLAGGTMTGNIAHASDFTLDVGGDITLDADGGDIRLSDGGTQFGKFTRDGGDFLISSSENDKHMKFAGADGGANITALDLDMENAGAANFNSSIAVGGTTVINGSGVLQNAALSGTYSNALNFSHSSLELSGHMFFNEYSTGRHYIHFKTAASTNQIDWRIQTNSSNNTIHSWTNTLASFATSMSVSGDLTVTGLLAVNKAANAAVGLSVGADSTATNSYGLEVCNSTANTRFLVDGVGNSFFYKSNNALGMRWDAVNGWFGINTTPSATLHVVGGGSSTDPTLELNSSTSTEYNHAINAFNANLTAGENNLIVVGKSGSTKESAYIGYKYSSAASNNNVLTLGHWGSNNLMNLTGDGKLGIGTESPGGLLTIKGTGDAIRVESTNTGVGGAQLDLLHHTTSPADNDVPAAVNFGGYYSGTNAAYSAAIRSEWRDVSAREGKLKFYTRNAGTFNTNMEIAHNGVVGIAEVSDLNVTGAVVMHRYNIGAIANYTKDLQEVTHAGIDHYVFTIQGNDTYQNLFNNVYSMGFELYIQLGDAASRDHALYSVNATSPAYGVSTFTQVYYNNGGWNTGSFSLQMIGTPGDNTEYTIQAKFASYYNSSNNATGYIQIRRLY